MPQSYVFIVTYGRSGSTLLQKILNSIDGYNIRGENYNALFNLYRACDSLEKTRAMWPTVPPLEWHGANQINVEQFEKEVLASFIKNVLLPDAGTRVSGVKEIRYPNGTDAEIMEFIKFVERSFHNCKIIFNIRDKDAVAKSSWWKTTNPESVTKMVTRMDALFRQAAADRPATRHLVDYDAYVKDPNQLQGLFRFLGEKFDEKKIKEILAVRLTH